MPADTKIVNKLERCRLVLVLPSSGNAASIAATTLKAIEAADVASLILPVGDRDEVSLQRLAEAVFPKAQTLGIATIVENDTRIAGRVKADGVHLETDPASLADAMASLGERLMVGAGGAKTRDDALDLGEAQPDYMFFGRFGYDNKPEAHPRNLKLGAWWAEMIQIPCIVLGGSDLSSCLEVAGTGAEFVALSSAVFGEGVDPAEAVHEANRLLDEAQANRDVARADASP